MGCWTCWWNIGLADLASGTVGKPGWSARRYRLRGMFRLHIHVLSDKVNTAAMLLMTKVHVLIHVLLLSFRV